MDERAILRRLVAAIAFRCEAAVSGAVPAFAAYQAGSEARTPGAVLHHIASLLVWTAELFGAEREDPGTDGTWRGELDRMRVAARRLDRVLEGADLAASDVGKALQGPLADALTHVGQLALLRRLAGDPMPRVSYPQADMRLGPAVPEER